MYNRDWSILVVDDEPDVLSLSKLVMKGFTVYGLPLKIYTATSKAEAIEVIEQNFTGPVPRLAVAFVDVVMETDSAGLELCAHIRDAMNNKFTQLYIRTGQPGLAPERDVIDHYEINGYFTKLEATEDKLYSLVKSGVRQFYANVYALGLSGTLHQLIRASHSREMLLRFLQASWVLADIGHGGDGSLLPNFTMIDGQPQMGGLDEAAARQHITRLDTLPGKTLSVEGDRVVLDKNHNMLLKIAGGVDTSEVYHLVQGQFAIPDVAIIMTHAFWSSFAHLWFKAF